MTRTPMATHWGAVEAEVEGGRLSGVAPFAKDRDPSPIIQSLPGVLTHSTRIAEPVVRASVLESGPGAPRERRGAEPFVAVGWENALDLVAGELDRVRTQHGNTAIYGGSYGWGSAGRLHNAPSLLHRFLNLIGGFTASIGSYSTAAAEIAMPHILGDFGVLQRELTDWRSLAEHTRLFVSFGGMPLRNSQVASGGCGNHAAKGWMIRSRANGARFVYLGPVKDDMADALEAEWLTPSPGTDTAVMLGIAHTLVAEGLHDRDFLARCTVGYERFESYLLGAADGTPKDATWAAAISGLGEDAIRALARRMARTRTFITISWSLQRADHGEQTYWMAVTLASMLGQIGLPGGGIGFGYGSLANVGNPADGGRRLRLREGANPTNLFIPVARVADMLLDPGGTVEFDGRRITYPDIRLVYWSGGNPFHHHQDLNRLLAAWRKPETIIVHEPWWTPLARHADIVLPATTSFERNDIGGASRDPFILAMHKAIAPVGAARDDFQIFSALAARMGVLTEFTEGRSEMDWLAHFYASDRAEARRLNIDLPPFEEFWRAGHVELPIAGEPVVMFDKFRRDPALYPLPTPSGRIELFSARVAGFAYGECPGHAVWREPLEWHGAALAARYPLHLISNQPSTRLHSQLDNGEVSRASKIADREPIAIHPDDASARSIADGAIVRIFNGRGACLGGAVVCDRVQRGVVQMATGAWYDPLVPGEIGSLCKHGNVNVLTGDRGTSRLGQGPSAHSCLVEVELFDGPPPPVTAFVPPPIRQRRIPT